MNPDFPCRPVAEVAFTALAQTVPSHIRVAGRHCPPQAPDGAYCAWTFRLKPTRPSSGAAV